MKNLGDHNLRMSFNSDSLMDALALIVRAVEESPSLQDSFRELAKMPVAERKEAIARITDEMKKRQESESLVEAFDLLALPYLFNAVSSALRDCGVDL